MLKSFSTTLLAFALAAPLPGFAHQDDAARQKELDAARADLQRAAKRVAELSKDAGRVGSPVEIDHLIVRRPRLGILLSGDDAAGVRITGVTPDGGAAKAGLKAGDRLLRVDGETVNGGTGDARVAHARKLLAEVGLDHRETHKPRQLSGGEQQRVAVARALVNEPLVLLADEPSGNLDTQTSGRLHDLLFDLRSRRRLSLVVVTHNADLAHRADRILRLEDGRLQPAPRV